MIPLRSCSPRSSAVRQLPSESPRQGDAYQRIPDSPLAKQENLPLREIDPGGGHGSCAGSAPPGAR